ncbi:MAG TPA: tRNA (adenosine(37)-N6)-threonylcarbamoyltransferase complex transferase subunit TsaD [Kiritimatiellia bacterium]|nr:tRNA (adenosine(37)-N6)-threonylcarbamoyltransferase complex transferase subunit TsaD [Kiritimatiellia bacterium]
MISTAHAPAKGGGPGLVLAIETSCDETSAAVVTREGRVLSNEVYSQIARHQEWGGVVPEIASRCHVEVLPGVIEKALSDAEVAWSDLEGIAVTKGPGLATSLLTGLASARALALRLDLPVAGVNHLDGHAGSVRLSGGATWRDLPTPVLLLLVSGGHTLLVREDPCATYTVIGRTLDDAAGEALDKGSKLLGLGYPGGPAIEATARGGNPKAVAFPLGMVKNRAAQTLPDGLSRDLCFSFSGVKTALLNHLRTHPNPSGQALADLAASYQEAVVLALADRIRRALEEHEYRTLACAGGVARNARLRGALDELACRHGVGLRLAEPEFCTDNAAMIGAAALLRGGWTRADDPGLDAAPNWRMG